MKIKKAVIGLILALFFAMPFAGCADVPEPTIKEGRFHFSVTYEVFGEEETVEGIYVCKFIKATSSINGWWREWKTYIENSDLKEEIEILENEDGKILLDLGLDPFYFMSDPFFEGDPPKPEFSISYNERKREETGDFWSFDVEELEGYGVKLISYEYDPPIENVYK